jgi:hypothetical protein
LKRGRPAKSKDVVNDVNLIDMLKNMEVKWSPFLFRIFQYN